MTIYPQKRDDPEAQRLRREGGAWLKELREKAGYTQRTFALVVGADYYTFISQIENGRGRVPPERYKLYADTLNIDHKIFMQGIMRYYDPHAYELLFGEYPRPMNGDEDRKAAVA